MFASFIENIKDKGQRATEVIDSFKDKETINKMAHKTVESVEKGVGMAIEKLFEGQNLTVSSELKTIMCQQVMASGNRQIINTLKYINEVVSHTAPRSIQDVKSFRENLCKKLLDDAKTSNPHNN